MGKQEIQSNLNTLEYISRKLRFKSQQMIYITLLNLSFSFLLFSGFIRIFVNLSFLRNFVILPIFCVIAVVIYSLRLDSLRKDGNIFFDEISDELHGEKLSEEIGIEDISLSARVTIRMYSNSASLPLIPGKYGPGIIVLTNIILTFISIGVLTNFSFNGLGLY